MRRAEHAEPAPMHHVVPGPSMDDYFVYRRDFDGRHRQGRVYQRLS